jgi:HEAT repeat protein
VQPSQKHKRHGIGRTARRLAGVAALSLGMCGCVGFWDDITSRDFSMKKLFTKPDPLAALQDGSDGDERHKALAALREPKQNGGTDKEQDDVVKILTRAATADPQPLCRMAAIRTLGRFKDPRAAEAIESVYLQKLPFGSETASFIRQECLMSLAETGGPIALRRLVLVAKEPPTITDSQDSQETLDRRLTAVRGLGKFKDPEAAAALAYVLQADKDIALRDRAHESLEACTGKHLPVDAPEWQAYLPKTTDVQQAGAKAPTSGAQNASFQTQK